MTRSCTCCSHSGLTVTFTAPEDFFNSIGLTDQADGEYMTVAVDPTWCDPDATLGNAVDNRAAYVWLFADHGAGTPFTGGCQVTVDPGTPDGSLLLFNGQLECYIGGTGPYTLSSLTLEVVQ